LSPAGRPGRRGPVFVFLEPVFLVIIVLRPSIECFVEVQLPPIAVYGKYNASNAC